MPIKTIYEPIYQTKVHFIFDTPKDKAEKYIIKHNLRPMHLHEKWGEKAGMMYGDEDSSNYFIILPNKKPTWAVTTIIAHEALHVVARVMRAKGISLTQESEEAFTYFHSWILQQLTDLLNKAGKSTKGKKK